MSIDLKTLNPARTGLILCDLQNDFLHPEGAYGRSGVTSPEIAAVPGRMKGVIKAMRKVGCSIVSTHFTLVPGRDGHCAWPSSKTVSRGLPLGLAVATPPVWMSL